LNFQTGEEEESKILYVSKTPSAFSENALGVLDTDRIFDFDAEGKRGDPDSSEQDSLFHKIGHFIHKIALSR